MAASYLDKSCASDSTTGRQIFCLRALHSPVSVCAGVSGRGGADVHNSICQLHTRDAEPFCRVSFDASHVLRQQHDANSHVRTAGSLNFVRANVSSRCVTSERLSESNNTEPSTVWENVVTDWPPRPLPLLFHSGGGGGHVGLHKDQQPSRRTVAQIFPLPPLHV